MNFTPEGLREDEAKGIEKKQFEHVKVVNTGAYEICDLKGIPSSVSLMALKRKLKNLENEIDTMAENNEN